MKQIIMERMLSDKGDNCMRKNQINILEGKLLCHDSTSK